ncbi:ROK family transcriptional regulator [Streptomyces capparidis]
MTTARTASPRTARAINDRLALELLAARGPLTANELKAATGLSRPTVADLVERLQERGLVRIVGEADVRRRGPNARLYGLAADRAHIAAVDVRTHGLACAVIDLSGRELAHAEVPVDPGLPAADAVARAVAALDLALRDSGARAPHTVAVGAPGLVDPATGELSPTGALPNWHGAFVAALRERLGAHLLLENEVNLAAVAELRAGAARDLDTFALMWLDEGVGAAVVLDGRLRRGASGGTGEIGFLPVPGTSGLPSATACDGGFHALAGGAAVRALAARHGIDAPSAGQAVRAGLSAGSEAFLGELAGRLALGAAALAAVLDPGCVLLGGEVGRSGGAELAARVERRLATMSPLRTEVRAAAVEGSPVLRGGVLTALETARAELFTTD